MSDAALDLKLCLLRGETPSPLDLDSFAGADRIRLRTQTKSAVSDRLAVRLLTLMASGRLPPGARLPPERQIAETVSVSRVCVRTALERLKNGGYLRSIQGSGTRVSECHAGGSLDRLIAANSTNLHDLMEICGHLDSWALMWAMRHGASAPRERLVALLTQPVTSADFAQREAEVRFALAEATQSEVFQWLMRHLSRGLERAQASPASETERALQVASHRLARALRHDDLPAASVALAERSAALLECNFHDGSTPRRGTGDLLEGDALLAALTIAQPDQLRARLVAEIGVLMSEAKLSDGAKLPSERQLADLFGVSRMSVREALGALKDQGLVRASARTGTHVWQAPLGESGQELRCIVQRSEANLMDVCALRHYLEAWSSRRAAACASVDDLSDMRRIIGEMRRPIPALRRKIDLDFRLHLTITRATGSAVALYITEVLRDVYSVYFDYTLTELFSPQRDSLLLEQHVEIVDAIMARDPDRAGRAMEAHCHIFRNLYGLLHDTEPPTAHALH